MMTSSKTTAISPRRIRPNPLADHQDPPHMKRAILAALAALTLCSGCLLDDEFWDGYGSTYDSQSGDDDYDSDCSC
ncbi:MAG: hypothetical protein ABL956_11855 [Hyphomonadaceae bacterium]